ncbi:hypothetical protein [Auraticoccus monumenti]|uniref:Uncharacterized protein n=1 Tax=Auraticoccus monumenti TaxID=675864 RepID=A0A1G6U3V3_9ACTN|nr:hypothetical protein [Auraticoccus monumenti]SDD36009.1 hypothetical protein SAMN04489747_0787 [Auraticoccus monumenti]
MEVPPGTWLDPRPLRRDWPEPAPPLRVPSWALWGVPVLLLALVLVAVTALGGFERRTDRIAVMAPGSELDTRDLVYTFTDATVQHQQDYDGVWEWEVVTRGTVRNPHDEPLSPRTGDYGSLVVRGVPGPETATIEQVSVSASLQDDFDHRRRDVRPGRATLPIEVSFVLPDSYRPADRIALGAFVMEYTDNYVLGLGGGERTWNKTDEVFMVYLPLVLLPEESY